MLTKTALPAALAILGARFVSADVCTESSVSVNSAADASSLSSCDTIAGTVTIGTEASGAITIDGPTSIGGDLICDNNGAITTLSSSSLKSIKGTFQLKNVTALTSISLSALTSVSSLDWQTLARLETLSFGSSGLSSANSIRVSDTFLSTLNAINVQSTKTLQIDNNRRLTEWTSNLETLSDQLIITANGFGLQVDLPDLKWIANMTISNVSSISVPSLQVVNGSMRFDSNYFSNFSAPNMTSTQDGDISFTGNSKLANISFPILTTIAGGFTIANNTELDTITGFPDLATVGGAVKIRGNFTSVELPALNDVKGAFDISSTANIDSTCETFKKLAPSKQGGNGKIQGTYSCTSNNANANDVNSSGSNSTSSNKNNSAPGLGLSFPTALLFAVGAAGAVQLVM